MVSSATIALAANKSAVFGPEYDAGGDIENPERTQVAAKNTSLGDTPNIFVARASSEKCQSATENERDHKKVCLANTQAEDSIEKKKRGQTYRRPEGSPRRGERKIFWQTGNDVARPGKERGLRRRFLCRRRSKKAGKNKVERGRDQTIRIKYFFYSLNSIR